MLIKNMADIITFCKFLLIILIIINILFMVIIFMFTTNESHQFYLFSSLTFINIIFLLILLLSYKDIYTYIYKSEHPRSNYLIK